MTTQEQIAVMQAYADGKKIQYAGRKSDLWADYEGNGTDWDFSRCKYRVKAESKYRPYRDCDELIEDYKKRFNVKCSHEYVIPLIWLKSDESERMLITCYDTNYVGLSSSAYFSLNEILKGYTYLDGSPVGKEEI